MQLTAHSDSAHGGEGQNMCDLQILAVKVVGIKADEESALMHFAT